MLVGLFVSVSHSVAPHWDQLQKRVIDLYKGVDRRWRLNRKIKIVYHISQEPHFKRIHNDLRQQVYSFSAEIQDIDGKTLV